MRESFPASDTRTEIFTGLFLGIRFFPSIESNKLNKFNILLLLVLLKNTVFKISDFEYSNKNMSVVLQLKLLVFIAKIVGRHQIHISVAQFAMLQYVNRQMTKSWVLDH